MPDRGMFFKEVSTLLDFLTLHPRSALQEYSTLVIVALVLVFSLSKFHQWGRAARSGFFLSLAVVTISTFFLLVVTVWGRYAIGSLGLVDGQQDAGLALLLGIAFFAGVTPFSRLCFKSAYFTSVAAWILTICLAGGMVYVCEFVWNAASGSDKPSVRSAGIEAEVIQLPRASSRFFLLLSWR